MAKTMDLARVHLQWFADNPDPDPAKVDPATDPGKGSSETPNWTDDLPEPLKASKTLAKFSGPSWKESLAKSYVELEGHLGKSIQLPGKDAKDEDWSKFFDRVGRPKAADDYAIEPVEGSDPGYLSKIKGMFHAAGLSQAQAERLHKHLVAEAVATNQAAAEARAKAVQDGETVLREAWGQKYDAKIETVRRFVLNTGGEDAMKHLEEIGVASDPVILQLIAAGAEASGPHRFIVGMNPKGGKTHPYDYMREQLGQA